MLKSIDNKKHARCDVKLCENLEGSLADVRISEDLDNGSIGVLGDYTNTANEQEVRAFNKPEDTSKKDELYLLDAPELIYDESRKVINQFKNFYNQSGEIVRAYPLSKIKKFSLSEEGIDASGVSKLAVGQYVLPNSASHKLKASTTSTNAIGKIVRIDTEGIATYYGADGKFLGNTYPMYVIQVL